MKLSAAIGFKKSTVHRWVQKGLIRSHTSAIHPQLTLHNRYERLQFVLSKLYIDRIERCLKFKEMDNVIHIDEKWFNITKSTQRYYLLEEEETPYRSCKSKRFIVKIMFLAAVSRPIYGENGEVLFDGNIGIFTFTYKKAARRNSVNRAAGTMLMKPIESINKTVTKEFLINKVIPAIKAKWPQNASKNIVIQQDNAPPHIKGDDLQFVEAATSDGWNIQLKQQPANSPDLNVLDLGFFRSIQSLQNSNPAKTVEELVKNVENAFETQKSDCLDNVWLNLQACMVEIMKQKGHNNYKVPHLRKATQRREGILPRNLTVTEDLSIGCMAYLLKNRNTNELQEMLTEIGLNMDLVL